MVWATGKYNIVQGVELIGTMGTWLILRQLLLMIELLLTRGNIPATTATDIFQEHIVVLMYAEIAFLVPLRTVILVLGHFICDSFE